MSSPHHKPAPLRVVVLISGSGSTLQNLIEHARQGNCPIEIGAVISSRAGVFGLERATQAGIPTCVIARRAFATSATHSNAVIEQLDRYAPDLVILAGYMSKLGLPKRYLGKVVNVHPALLPAFGGKGMYGIHVHEAVLAAKAKVSGCTVHFVNNAYDAGPVILQKEVPVRANDTPQSLQERVQAAEREVYPKAIRLIAEGKARYAE